MLHWVARVYMYRRSRYYILVLYILKNLQFTMVLYSTSREIEPIEILAVLSIHWCACEVNSYKIMFLVLYSMINLLEFQEGYMTSTMVNVDMCEILHVLWEQDNKV